MTALQNHMKSHQQHQQQELDHQHRHQHQHRDKLTKPNINTNKEFQICKCG
ncbi:hypothetical protein DPMN_087133 [Dreissena polymorpha]|uniref:Uncharacterized protein n=1 Tax=Dreissena polymorpha TaxID=45954 RepID=A0A9D4KRP2_DREPO|nr:hypothetical protein DPMN_087133 [Dreissena polymorpha]